MERLVPEDAEVRKAPEKPASAQGIKIAAALAIFAIAGYLAYVNGVFGEGGKSSLPPERPLDPAIAKHLEEEQKRAEELSKERARQVESGRAPKPITSTSN